MGSKGKGSKRKENSSASSSSRSSSKITTSSTAEYFSKNLQQVGFSSQTKAVLTTLKEAVDNSLDACEDAELLPEVNVVVSKEGTGTLKNADRIRVCVEDNGPGIEIDDVAKVFGEYLASSKFGRGRCSRGQQGIGISAATTWAQLTSATGVKVISKSKNMRKAVSCTVEVDIKNNKGVLKDKETIDWNRPHGTFVEFFIDGRIQTNGEAGLMNYLMGTALVNPHLTLHYKIGDMEKKQTIERVTNEIPSIPEATEPHPHTLKLGEFIAHSHLFGKVALGKWLKKGFSRVTENTLQELTQAHKISKGIFAKNVDAVQEDEFKGLYTALQKLVLKAPSTSSVLAIGEKVLAQSILRMGDIDFFSVVTRKPTICDAKPIQIEIAMARLKDRAGQGEEDAVQVLRFANRVPLQFDKAGCAIVHAINSVNWRAYGLQQPKNSLPQGPYIIAVSVVSPFIKFKNASKETIDASDELVEEIRRALIQAGQRLSRHIRRESKASELEQKVRHIEQFGPILVQGLCRILEAPVSRKKKAEQGLVKLLEKDAKVVEKQLEEADIRLEQHLEKREGIMGIPIEETVTEDAEKTGKETKAALKDLEEKAADVEEDEDSEEGSGKKSKKSKTPSASETKTQKKNGSKRRANDASVVIEAKNR